MRLNVSTNNPIYYLRQQIIRPNLCLGYLQTVYEPFCFGTLCIKAETDLLDVADKFTHEISKDPAR